MTLDGGPVSARVAAWVGLSLRAESCPVRLFLPPNLPTVPRLAINKRLSETSPARSKNQFTARNNAVRSLNSQAVTQTAIVSRCSWLRFEGSHSCFASHTAVRPSALRGNNYILGLLMGDPRQTETPTPPCAIIRQQPKISRPSPNFAMEEIFCSSGRSEPRRI